MVVVVALLILVAVIIANYGVCVSLFLLNCSTSPPIVCVVLFKCACLSVRLSMCYRVLIFPS